MRKESKALFSFSKVLIPWVVWLRARFTTGPS
jgi:hypothetical protein